MHPGAKWLSHLATVTCAAVSFLISLRGATAAGLEELRDIHLPPALPGIQPAPIWWLLVFFLVTAVAVSALQRRRSQRTKNPAFRTQQSLDKHFRQWQTDSDRVANLHSTAATLKLLAVHSAPRNTTARLTGSAWISWLNGQSIRPIGSIGEQALTTELYQSDPQTDINGLHQALCAWLQDYGKISHA